MVLGVGAGIIDSGVNALFMDLYPGERTTMLNRLHLWVAIGALVAPLAIGQLLERELAWQWVAFGSAVAAALVGVALAVVPMPSGRRGSGVEATAVDGTSARRPGPASTAAFLPLAALALAIACYIATEMGVTSWVVLFLSEAPVGLATLTLSLFWAGLALGRLVFGRIGERLSPDTLAIGMATIAGAAILSAVALPVLPLRLVLFAVAGFAAGPIYPTIMAIGGARYPDRTSFVAAVLAASAVVGALVYPPLVGFISATAGLAAGMAGAGVVSLVTAGAVVVAGRTGRGAALQPLT